MSNTVKTLAHVWATEQAAQNAQAQVDTALGFPSGDTLHYQTFQYQEGTGYWMMADGNTVSVLGMGDLQVIDEIVNPAL
jgi:hypothetical protein